MNLKARLRAFLRSAAEEAVGPIHRDFAATARRLEALSVEVGRSLVIQNEGRHLPRLRDYGFRVFSQYGEDGVIQHLISRVPIESETFIEIGVEDYTEANTRFLLLKDNWRGLILDLDDAAGHALESSGLSQMRSVDFRQAKVDAKNVNTLLTPFQGDLGLLSIDVDGMDYYLWEALTVVSPRIVVLEYRSDFGPDHALVVPYDPDFDRSRHHASGLCYGASLAALAELGQRKGYALVGVSDGPNAFLVRRDVLGELQEVAPGEAHEEARFREVRSSTGDYLRTASARRAAMADATVVDLSTGRLKRVDEIFPDARPA